MAELMPQAGRPGQYGSTSKCLWLPLREVLRSGGVGEGRHTGLIEEEQKKQQIRKREPGIREGRKPREAARPSSSGLEEQLALLI